MAKVICLFLCLLPFSFVNCQYGLLTNVAKSINDVLRLKRDVDPKAPSCPTVNNMPARCVDLESGCPRLYKAAKDNSNNPRFQSTITQLQCGSRNVENIQICCPEQWIPKAPSAKTEPPPRRQPAEPKPTTAKPPEETCESLNSGHLPGRCVSLVDCPSLYKQAIERSKDEAVRNEMYRIHCGWVDSQKPKICCPLESIATPSPTQASDEVARGDAPTQDAGDFVDSLPSPPDCGLNRMFTFRVVGGRKARLGMFPWMALLGYHRRSDIMWLCGGSLISKRHVLTAAHCIHKNEKSLFQVRLGELDLTRDDEGTTPIDVPIKKKIIHEQYIPKIKENDIGMLTLAEDVQYTDLIKPLCMPVRPELRSNSFEDYKPYLAGWGQIKYAGNASDYLQYIRIPVTNTAECNEIYKKDDNTFKTLDNRSLCAGYKLGKMDSCTGDSGGPLVQSKMDPKIGNSFMYQIGIISFGKSCGAAGYPGIYVRVTEYIPWIFEKTTGKIVS